MSFWTQNSLEPKRAFRFRVKSSGTIGLGTDGNGYWWNAKKADKPSFVVNSNKYRLINHEINVPGIVSWNPITIELADVGRTTDALMQQLGEIGYKPDNLTLDGGIGKGDGNGEGALFDLHIQQMNGIGEVIEDWTLQGAFISEMRLSTLDYSSDDIVSITLTITYDYALLN